LHDAKYKQPEKRWKDVPIVLTSNTIPDVLKKKEKEDKGYYDYMAFRTRIRFH